MLDAVKSFVLLVLVLVLFLLGLVFACRFV